MTKPTLRVKAGKGRRCPIHPTVATGVGGAMLFIAGDEEHDLPDVSYVRRRIAVGDLVVVTPVPSMTPAPSAPPKEKP